MISVQRDIHLEREFHIYQTHSWDVQIPIGNVLIKLKLVNTYLLHGGTEAFRKLNILGQSSAPFAYPNQWCNTRLLQDPDLGSCSGCALPCQWLSAHVGECLSKSDKGFHLMWHLSFLNSWHQGDRLPDNHYQKIFVGGFEPFLDLSLSLLLPDHRVDQTQGWLRRKGRTRM